MVSWRGSSTQVMCVSWCQSMEEVWSVSGGLWVSWGREAPWGIFLLLLLLVLTELSFPVWKLQEQEERLLLHKWSCGSFTWLCGGLEVGVELYTSASRFLEARASIGAGDLCWKSMWCPEQEEHFSCHCCQYRTKRSWNVQSLLVISGSFTGTLVLC